MVAIDLGSNSFRVLKYSCVKQKEISSYQKTVSTAYNLKKTSKISRAAIDRIIKAIIESKKQLRYKNAIALSTAAMRIAKNRDFVIDTIYKKTGIKFDIIDGDFEAKLTLIAAKRAVKNIKDFILIDIGGGSTEVVIYLKNKIKSKSVNLGLVTLSQSNNKKEILDKFKLEIKEFVKNKKLLVLATAGTPTTIASLKQGLTYYTYSKDKINNTIVTLEDILYYQKYLKTLSNEEVDNLIGKGRANFIDAGIEIYKMLYEALDIKESIVIDDGLREGIVYYYCEKYRKRI